MPPGRSSAKDSSRWLNLPGQAVRIDQVKLRRLGFPQKLRAVDDMKRDPSIATEVPPRDGHDGVHCVEVESICRYSFIANVDATVDTP